jgi:hypothetical protein
LPVKIFLRHSGHILEQAELSSGELAIGRSKENGLKVAPALEVHNVESELLLTL